MLSIKGPARCAVSARLPHNLPIRYANPSGVLPDNGRLPAAAAEAEQAAQLPQRQPLPHRPAVAAAMARFSSWGMRGKSSILA